MAVISTPLPRKILNSEGFELNRSSSQAAGLVGWWPLGAYPDGRDKSLYANHGVLDNTIDSDVPTAVSYSSTTGVSRVSRRALEFSSTGSSGGDKDFITVPHHDNYNITGDMTITMWATVNTPAWNTQFYTLLSRNDYGDYTSPYSILWWLNTKRYSLYIGTGSGAVAVGPANNATTYGVWDFIAARISGTDMHCLVNMNYHSEGASTFSGSRQTNTRPLRIGGSIYGDPTPGRLGTYNHGGHIDDVRIYKRALSDPELSTIWRQTLDGGYGDLVAKPRRFHSIPLAAAEPEVVAATHKQIDLVEGPSSEFDVVTEVRDERRGGAGRGTFCPVGVVNASSFGTRSDPSTQAGLNRLDNRFVRGANQGDKIKSN